MNKAIKKKKADYQLDDRSRGTNRASLTCLIDCPVCYTKMKLTEQIKDNSTAKGKLLILERGK